MFQYTHETILNKVDGVTVVEGLTNPYTLKDAARLTVRRAGEYYSDCIVGDIYKTVAVEGTPGKLVLDTTKITELGEYLLTFRVITPNQFYAEYASPNWQVFGKPIVVGFAITDTTKVYDEIESAIKLAIPEGNEFIKVGKGDVDTDLVIEGTNNYMTFDKANLGKETHLLCPADTCETEYVTVSGAIKEIAKNVEDFATKQWLIENLRFPTYPNIRYASANDEMPTAETYTEYAFTYSVPRVGLGGLSGVGQGLTATTRHIFYVPTDDEEIFEDKLAKLGVKILTKNVANITVTEDDPATPETVETVAETAEE